MKPSNEQLNTSSQPNTFEKLFEKLPHDWVESHQLVVDIFKSVRSELTEQYGGAKREFKSDGSYVTELDIRVERILKTALAEQFPQFGFEGEETGKSGDATQYWLVDPIDGTTSFIRGTGRSTNAAALMNGEQPVMSAIFDFVNNELFVAAKDTGAYSVKTDSDGKETIESIHVSTRPIQEAFVDNMSPMVYPEVYSLLRPLGLRIFQPIGAASRSMADVARGSLEGVVIKGALLGKHDLMPGLLLAREAGAVVVPLDTNGQWSPLSPGDYAIVSPALAPDIRALVFNSN